MTLKQEMINIQHNLQVLWLWFRSRALKKPELFEFLYRINLSADEPEGINFTHTQTHTHCAYDKAFPDPEAP